MAEPHEMFLGSLMLIWVVLIALVQFDRVSLGRYDYFRILPGFRFFAPRPIAYDVKIFARTASCEGDVSTWKELFDYNQNRGNLIWNPHQKLRKMVLDLYREIATFRDADEIKHMCLSYLTVLNHSSALMKGRKQANFVQFIFTAERGFQDESNTCEILFQSNWHTI